MNKILIVDDIKSWLLFHKETITEFFGDYFEITFADSANDALNLIRSNLQSPYDIIITDLQMESDYEPLLAGEWLIEQIKTYKEYAASKIIIISSMYNIEAVAGKYNVECISKNIIVHNRLLMKFMFTKLMPSLNIFSDDF